MALSSFAGGRLWGAREGAGRPRVLALPGWGRDHTDFAPVLAGLDAVALDLPGFGAAPDPPDAWSTAEYAELVGAALSDFAARVTVVGHSFGARVAVHLAADPRVTALVLTGAPLAPPPGQRGVRPSPVFRTARALSRLGIVGAERMERLRSKYGSEDYRRATPVMRGVLVKSVEETATSAYIPALRAFARDGGSLELVWGTEDRVASLAGVSGALAGLPDGAVRVTTVRGAGHLLSPALVEALRATLLRQGASAMDDGAR
jgi:pimeloyl-ACP methyl ester carboxylesterase